MIIHLQQGFIHFKLSLYLIDQVLGVAFARYLVSFSIIRQVQSYQEGLVLGLIVGGLPKLESLLQEEVARAFEDDSCSTRGFVG